MKRKLLVALLGLAAVSNSFGQGHILISNYVTAPYSQVYWHPVVPVVGNQAVKASQGVQFEVWYAEGTFTDPAFLTSHSPAFGILSVGGSESYDPGVGHGPGGYYLVPDFPLPTWQAGDTFTFQVRVVASFGIPGSSDLWTENSAISSAANPANAVTFSPGVVVGMPEPSSAALATVSAVSLAIFRRRKWSTG